MLREKHRLRVPTRITEPKRDEVTGGWRKINVLYHYVFVLVDVKDKFPT
jgi:hypothetical protein